MSQHPPHLAENELIPTALIPFCSFSGSMNITGRDISGLDIPACSKFQEDTVDDQLCYTFHVNTIMTGPSQPGKGKGLVFAVDKGLSIGALKPSTSNDDSLESLMDTADPVNMDSVTVYIATPHRFRAVKQGRYTMTALKKMTGTKSFLNMLDETKGCQIDSEGECKRMKLRQQFVAKCACLPFALRTEDEVSLDEFCKIFKHNCFRMSTFVAPWTMPASRKYHLKTLTAKLPAQVSMQMCGLQMNRKQQHKKGC